MSKPSDLVQGTLDLLLLKILALEPMHGWAISQRLNQVSADVLRVSDGSLYPAFTSWSMKAGLRPSGRPVTWAGARSSIRLPGWTPPPGTGGRQLGAALRRDYFRVVRLKEA